MTDHNPDSLGEELDRLLASPRPPQAASDADPLIQMAVRLANAPRPAMSPRTSARIRAQVIEAHKRQLQPTRAPRVPRWTRWIAVASAIAALLIVGLLPAAAASLPGEALYPVKQVIEQGELFFAASPSARAEVYLTHAERRVQEADTLLQRGHFNPEVVTAALDEMTASASAARVSASPGTDLQARTIEVTAHLNGLVEQAARTHLASATTAAALNATINNAQASGALLLPPPPAATPPTPPETMIVTPEATLEPRATESLPVDITIEGPVDAINGSVITIYGIDVPLDPSDPLLGVIQIGDVIRVEGNVGSTGGAVIVPVKVTSETSSASDQGQVWRDNGQCNNPPPPWAQANGWHRRCGGTGNSQGNGNGNGNGGGQGRGK